MTSPMTGRGTPPRGTAVRQAAARYKWTREHGLLVTGNISTYGLYIYFYVYQLGSHGRGAALRTGFGRYAILEAPFTACFCVAFSTPR